MGQKIAFEFWPLNLVNSVCWPYDSAATCWSGLLNWIGSSLTQNWPETWPNQSSFSRLFCNRPETRTWPKSCRALLHSSSSPMSWCSVDGGDGWESSPATSSSPFSAPSFSRQRTEKNRVFFRESGIVAKVSKDLDGVDLADLSPSCDIRFAKTKPENRILYLSRSLCNFYGLCSILRFLPRRRRAFLQPSAASRLLCTNLAYRGLVRSTILWSTKGVALCCDQAIRGKTLSSASLRTEPKRFDLRGQIRSDPISQSIVQR